MADDGEFGYVDREDVGAEAGFGAESGNTPVFEDIAGGVGPFTACTADEFLVCTALIRLDSLLANDPEAYGFDGYDEIFPPDEDFESVWDYEDYVLAESDYPILLNPRLDGIENDPAVGKQLRLRHLHPSEWFIINDQEE